MLAPGFCSGIHIIYLQINLGHICLVAEHVHELRHLCGTHICDEGHRQGLLEGHTLFRLC